MSCQIASLGSAKKTEIFLEMVHFVLYYMLVTSKIRVEFKNKKMIKIRNLTKTFGGLVAVNQVNLDIKEGILYAIIGPNGAGKTTLLNLISGQLTPTKGRIEFASQNITGVKLYEASRLGIARSYQHASIFPNLGVKENIRVAIQSKANKNYNFFKRVGDFPKLQEDTHEVLEKVGLMAKADRAANELSHGERKALDIGIALATNPTFLLLDEPASGLSSEEVTEMIELIKEIAKDTTVVLVEHKLDLVMSIAEKVIVLHRGSILAEGTPEQIQKDEEVQSSYLGKS